MLLLNTRLQLEEERDTLQVRCTRNRTTIAELRACLQHERDGKTPSSWLLRTILTIVMCMWCVLSIKKEWDAARTWTMVFWIPVIHWHWSSGYSIHMCMHASIVDTYKGYLAWMCIFCSNARASWLIGESIWSAILAGSPFSSLMHSVVRHFPTMQLKIMKHTDSHIQTTFVDLERKIAAIAQVDSSLNSTSTQEQVMISVWLLYLIKHILVKQ